MYDINSTCRTISLFSGTLCFIRLVLWQRYKVFHNGTTPCYGDNKYSHYLSLQSASSSVSYKYQAESMQEPIRSTVEKVLFCHGVVFVPTMVE